MKWPVLLKYGIIMIAGILIVFIGSKIQSQPVPPKGEYFLSSWLRDRFTWPVRITLCLAGFISGYLTRLKPLVSGLLLSAIFPLVAMYEATIFRGSHNLIPLEFLVYLVWSLPAIIGAYAGRLAALKKHNRLPK